MTNDNDLNDDIDDLFQPTQAERKCSGVLRYVNSFLNRVALLCDSARVSRVKGNVALLSLEFITVIDPLVLGLHVIVISLPE